MQSTHITSLVDNATPYPDSEVVAKFGDLGDGSIGVEIGSQLSEPAFRVDNIDGITNPDLATTFRTTLRSISFNHSSVQSVWFSDQGFKASYKGFYYYGYLRADVGTNFNVWLGDSSGGTTSVIPMVGTGLSNSILVEFAWLHTVPLGDPISVALRVQRTLGAGDIIAFEPYAFRFVGPEGCTVTGV